MARRKKSVHVQCRCHDRGLNYVLLVHNNIIFSNIFDLRLVESPDVDPTDIEPMDTKPIDMEGQL